MLQRKRVKKLECITTPMTANSKSAEVRRLGAFPVGGSYTEINHSKKMTAEEYRNLKPKKPNKYRNKPVIVDGIRFDSMLESDYYCKLKLK